MPVLRYGHCYGIFFRSKFLSDKWMSEKGFLIPEAPAEPKPWWETKRHQPTQTKKEVLMTFFIYLKVVGDSCQLPPPFSTFLRATICILPRSHWDPEGESHGSAPSQGCVRVRLKHPFHLQAVSPAYMHVDNREKRYSAPAAHLSAASTPAHPVCFFLPTRTFVLMCRCFT